MHQLHIGMLARRALVRNLLTIPAISLGPGSPAFASTSAFINPLTGDSKASWQSDDKSFDFSVPKGWTVTENPRGADGHLISAVARRDDGKASLEAVCDVGKFGNSLSEYGSLKAAGSRLLADLPGAELVSAEFFSNRNSCSYNLFKYTAGGQVYVTKQAVAQKRRYQLTVRSTAGRTDATLQEELEAIVALFQVFPINFICLGQSNGGSRPADGSCY